MIVNVVVQARQDQERDLVRDQEDEEVDHDHIVIDQDHEVDEQVQEKNHLSLHLKNAIDVLYL